MQTINKQMINKKDYGMMKKRSPTPRKYFDSAEWSQYKETNIQFEQPYTLEIQDENKLKKSKSTISNESNDSFQI